MRTYKESEFNADNYDKSKVYGTYSTHENSFVVGPFNSHSDASIWLDNKQDKNPDTVLDDYYVLSATDIKSLIDKNTAGVKKPKM